MSQAGRARRRSAVRLISIAATSGALLAMQPSVGFASGSGRVATGMHPYSSSLSKADIQRLAAHANKRVIVIMKNQHASLQPGVSHLAARAAATRSTESAVVSELRTLHANNLHAYKLISAVSATVSAAEAARLRNDPSVRAVVPDRQVHRPAASPTTPATTAAPPPVVKANHVPGTCPKDPTKPLLPEALQVMHATAAQKIANGHGVKVAVFPDGVDPTITDFKRPGSNQPVIFDYRDWSGEGITAQTGGAEAFGDVSSIASQGRQVYDLSKEVDSQVPLPAHCNIRVLGVAPGASVAVMKVFGENVIPFNSEILQGMDYAVNVDHVDIL
ncbi:MAG: protease inhibitor I9 family protein, partial [Frankiales bacterium]|nr:protease inhibitor I9 family protein [Frankiales bacterium]